MMRSDVTAALRSLARVRAPEALHGRVFARVGLVDTYVRVGSAIGDVFVATGERGISGVRLAREGARFEQWHAHATGRPAQQLARPGLQLRGRISRYLRGDRAARAAVDLRGCTAFERAVLEKTREIPRGEVRPYAWIAREIGHPRAVRAVGTALGRNPVPLVIPCHRVVRSDGTPGSYVFGARAKRALLASEGVRL